jgi:hypothetical protein
MSLNETIIAGKGLSAVFPFQYGIKQGDAFSTLLFTFA